MSLKPVVPTGTRLNLPHPDEIAAAICAGPAEPEGRWRRPCRQTASALSLHSGFRLRGRYRRALASTPTDAVPFMAGRACAYLHLALSAFTGAVGNCTRRRVGAGRASGQEHRGKHDGRHGLHGFSPIGFGNVACSRLPAAVAARGRGRYGKPCPACRADGRLLGLGLRLSLAGGLCGCCSLAV